jgi:uncharacterized protein (TIGR02145 family)
MNYKNLIPFSILFIFMVFPSCKNKEKKTGTQVWATKNLDVSTFRNGDKIAEAPTNKEWEKAGASGMPAWCYYKNDLENGKKYGKLYNWYAVNDKRGLAPAGWHIPTDAEWVVLTKFLGESAGLKVKSTTGWKNDKNGTNEIDFGGLPGGCRNVNGTFYGEGYAAYFWSTTEDQSYYGWFRQLSDASDSLGRMQTDKRDGLSVRCLKD